MTIHRLLAKGSQILTKIFTHPFNQQLANGTLSPHVFKLYLEQDALYLFDFAKALNLLSHRFEDRRHAKQFQFLSQEILHAEINLHVRYLGKSPQSMTFFHAHQRNPIKKMPVISQYTDHLIETTSRGAIVEGVISCIPCFWIYHQLGRHMAHLPVANNPFHLWISSYSSTRFKRSTMTMLEIADQHISSVTCPHAQANILLTMLRSLHFELQFFDSVMALENNPRNDFIHPSSTLILPK